MLLSGLLALAAGAWADTLSPEAALSRALQEDGNVAKSRANSDFTLKHTFKYRDLAIGYMFTAGPQGFLLVSADDMATPTLGYSDSEHFDATSIPDGLQYWLDAYAQEIEWARSHPDQLTRRVSRAEDRAPIEPMVKTHWNQDEPYNDLCPLVQGKRSVTGCVATAMAQILNYYKYPTKGEGSVTYKIDATMDGEGNVISGTDWSFDFANTTFDWGNMLDTYDNINATDAQKKAVATLMSACGVSVRMDYSPNESGAPSEAVPYALINYFGYSNSAYLACREYYDQESWETLVYDQLASNGPLLYSGQSDTSGHSFVCDGYNGDGYYHINWGWGGMSDGYYRLTALDPDSQGIGGSTSGYNFMQSIVCDVKPSKGGDRHYTLALGYPFVISETTSKVRSTITWGECLTNYSAYAFSGYINLAYEPVNGGTVAYANPVSIDGMPGSDADGSLAYYSDIHSTIPGLSDGEYMVYPVWSKDSESWSRVLCPIFGSAYYTAKVSSKTVTFVAESKVVPELNDVEVSPIYESGSLHLTASAYNSGASEYYGRVCALLYTSDFTEELFESSPVMIDLLPGKSLDFEIANELRLNRAYTGDAKLVFVDMLSGLQLGDAVDVTINKAAEAASLQIGAIEYGSGYSEVQEADDLCFQVNVKCTAGYFGGYLKMIIYPNEAGSYYVGLIQSEYLSLESGESKDVVFRGALPDGVDGKEYVVIPEYDGNVLWDISLVFTLSNKTSAAETVNEDQEGVMLYDLSGRRIEPGRATNGVYISKPVNGGKARKVLRTSN